MFLCDGHTRKQLDGAFFQALDAFAVGTGKIADLPAFFVCDMVEKIDGNAFHLAIGIGEDQGGVLMKANDDLVICDGCCNATVQPDKNEHKDRADFVFHEAIWGCMIQSVQLLGDLR